MINLRNRAEIDFGSLTEGRLFLYNDGLFMTVEKFDDDGWTNAICIESPYCKSGNRNNFCDNIKVIPLSEVDIDYEI